MTVNHLTVRKYRLPVIAALLAACAGSVDVFAFFGVGNAFAGIVTGNLVMASYGIASGDAALIRPTVTAVAGCILGELAWARLLRRPGTALPLLIAELTLLVLVLIRGWPLVRIPAAPSSSSCWDSYRWPWAARVYGLYARTRQLPTSPEC